MLSRVVRSLILGTLFTWLVWATLCLARGHLIWAVLPAVALAVAHGFFLALELLLLQVTARRAASTAPSVADLVRAWWSEFRIAPRIFCWQQPFRSGQWPDQADEATGGATRAVLLVHGYVCNRGLWNDWLKRLTRQQVPFAAISLEPVFGSIDSYVPSIEHAIVRLTTLTGRAPVVVAHSMGGLAVRRWWAQASIGTAGGSATRLHHLITIGTPHHGTLLAAATFTENARQMRQDSDWLELLQKQEPASHRRRTTCFYSTCDNIVFPCKDATLDGADNRCLEATGHVAMIARPEPFAELQRRLNEHAQ